MKHSELLRISEETDINFAPYYNMLPELINARGYKRGIEIGVYTGGHASAILERTKLEHLVGVDPYMYYENGMPGFNTDEDYKQLKFHALSRMPVDRFELKEMTSDQAYNNLKFEIDKGIARMFDFVFIDGLHTEEQARKDLKNYANIVNFGGVISGHDIDHGSFPGVTVAIEEFARITGKEIVRGPFHAWYINW
jgi:hypothetical protein